MKEPTKEVERLRARITELEGRLAERAQSECVLRQSEQRLRAIFDHTSHFIGLLTPDGILLEANRSSLLFTGLEEADVLGRPFWETPWFAHSAEQRSELREAIRRAACGKSVCLEVHHPGVDGSTHHVDASVQPVKDESGRVIFLVPEGRDITDRKQAEEAWRESEERLRSFMDSAPDGFVLCDAELKILDINAVSVKDFGLESRDDAIGRDLGEFVPSVRQSHRLIRYEEVLKTGVPFDDVDSPPDGSFSDRHFSITAFRMGEGIGFIAQDITERRLAEEALRDSDERWRSLVENIPNYILTLDRDGTILTINRLPEGLTADQVIGRKVTEFMPPEAHAVLNEGIANVFEHQALALFENGAPGPDGSTTWYDTRISPVINSGEVVNAVLIGTDITARKHAEEALDASEQQFRAIAENLPGAVFTYDVDRDSRRTPVYLGPGFEELIGKASYERIGQGDTEHFFELLHPDDVLALQSSGQFDPTFAQPVDQEYRLRTEEGGYRWVRSIGLPVPVNSTTLRWHGMLLDITERKIAEERRGELELQLRHAHKLQAVGQLAAGVAHDFNGFLAVVLGNAELLKSKLDARAPEGTESVHDGPLDQIIQAVERGRSLVQKLLAFGRARGWNPQPMDLNRVIAEMRKMLETLAGRSIRLTIDSDPSLHHVRGDVAQVEQVILNLALNARDAMPSGGELIIATANVGLDQKRVATGGQTLKSPHVMLVVTDTGCGMAEEILERAFEPFYSTKPVDKGTGLGLSIVHGIVHRASGHIEVESRPDQGTTFRIYFPVLE